MKWYLINAENRVVGHVAVKAVTVLRGKNKVTFMPNKDNGDHVVIINATKAVLTGKKMQQKEYGHHTRHPGGLRIVSAAKMMVKKPEHVIFHAVAGMIPRNRLKKKMLTRLHVYGGSEHKHTVNNPTLLE